MTQKGPAMDDLGKLIERLSQATEPDRELDGLIEIATTFKGRSGYEHERGRFYASNKRILAVHEAPTYTASIDAAAKLCPQPALEVKTIRSIMLFGNVVFASDGSQMALPISASPSAACWKDRAMSEPFKRSKEWWLQKARSEPDCPITAGVPTDRDALWECQQLAALGIEQTNDIGPLSDLFAAIHRTAASALASPKPAENKAGDHLSERKEV